MNAYDPKWMRQSIEVWQKSLDLYRANPMIEAQQAWINGMQAWMSWSTSMMKIWGK
jgi:hypothetical protein